jgi:ubiquinone/menaquinone biosynthesis C-methylase UbiE
MSHFPDHFSQLAERYANYRPHYPPWLFQYIASQCSIQETAWDCATGNGQAALGLTSYFTRIIATDASIQQIHHAFPHEQITYHVSSAENVTKYIPDQSIDLITVGEALHWFDVSLFFQEVQRVLKPKTGILAVWCYYVFHIPHATESLKVALNHFYQLIEPYWPPETKLVHNGYQDIHFPLKEIPVLSNNNGNNNNDNNNNQSFEMIQDWNATEVTGYLMTWSGTKRFMDQHGSQPIQEAVQAIHANWSIPEKTTMRIVWPLTVRLFRGVEKNVQDMKYKY